MQSDSILRIDIGKKISSNRVQQAIFYQNATSLLTECNKQFACKKKLLVKN